MKKTTKFLLVLAAVVAMTIGAVSTVMAADYPQITWDAADKWTAKDENGKKITSGWAVDPESGWFYYFVKGEAVTDNFITTGKEVYYVGGNGAMHTGWLAVGKKDVFSKNGSPKVDGKGQFSLVGAVGGSTEEVVPFADNTAYKDIVWLYFDATTGAMVKNEWEQIPDADGNKIWYYFDNAYCVIGDYDFTVKYDEGTRISDAKKWTKYGFSDSGSMLAGWIAVEHVGEGEKASGEGPMAKPAKPGETTYAWTYYAESGKKVEQGWEKIDGEWFYFVPASENFAKAGLTAVSNTYITIDGDSFYFDDSCYMAKGEITLGGNAKEDTIINVLNVTGGKVSTGTAITIKKKETLNLVFNLENGSLNKGAIDGAYYEDNKGAKYTLTTVVSGGAIDVEIKAAANLTQLGSQWTNDFLYIIDKVAYYYEGGYMVKNKVVQFGENVLVFGSDGKLISKETTIDGIKYVPSKTPVGNTGICYSAVK